MSFITDLYGEAHSYYKEFTKKSDNTYLPLAESKVHIIQSVKEEIENGWLLSYKKLITAEVFSDFLEMGKYLLDEKYKDPAAVMIGSVLEEHLRQLCATYSVDTTVVKGNDVVAKKADLLNADLVKVGAYGVLEQKNVTAWLDLRNRAAHGKYGEYVIEQVQLMYQGVLDFVSRIN
ncbi:hypothetical protein [Spirosoma telluris]|uniref:hypothetical protein n=1 Tax=Spirosoma telluris TaxID=2183553 RepID=UPI0018DB688C